MEEFVKMSPKGQLVVPQSIREEASFAPGDRFVAMPLGGGVLFKRVKMPQIKEEYRNLAREIERQFERNKVTRKDVADAVAWVRKK